MAYIAGTLVNVYSGPLGDGFYLHDAGSDSMATVAASGYFNNNDDDLNLGADDVIHSKCGDGDIWHRVSAISSGVVTTQAMSNEGPWNGVTGTASGEITVPGITEIGTGTGSAFILSAAPHIGAKVTIVNMGTATAGVSVITNATGVTLNGAGDRTITFNIKGTNVTLIGVSTTRWVSVGGGTEIDYS